MKFFTVPLRPYTVHRTPYTVRRNSHGGVALLHTDPLLPPTSPYFLRLIRSTDTPVQPSPRILREREDGEKR